MRQISVRCLLAIAVILAAGCTNTRNNGNPLIIEPLNQSATPASLVVVNNSSEMIYFLNVSLSTDTGWGLDQLGSQTIPAGGSFTLSDIVPGTYDFRVQTDAQALSATNMDVILTSGQTYTWTITATDLPPPVVTTPTTATLVINNTSADAIYYCNISPASDTTWGYNALGSQTIAAGASRTFTGLDPATYDLRVQSSGRAKAATLMGLALTAGQTYAWTVTSGNLTLTPASTLVLINESTDIVSHVHLQAYGDTILSIDLLNGLEIAPYDSQTFYNIPADRYNVLVADYYYTYGAVDQGLSLPAGETITRYIYYLSAGLGKNRAVGKGRLQASGKIAAE